MKVDEGSKILLTTDNIRVTDQDTALSDLMVQLESPPKFGTLVSYQPGRNYLLCREASGYFD